MSPTTTDTTSQRPAGRGTSHDSGLETVLRAGALAGAATVLGLAARRNSASAWSGAAALALPLAVRGFAGRWPLEEALRGPATVDVVLALAIARPPREVYDAWRDLESLPEILRHLEAVEDLGDGRSRWVAKTPLGLRVEWRAEILEEKPGELLRWRSIEGSDVDQEGALELRPWRSDDGTLLRLHLRVAPPRHRNVPGPAAADLVRPALERQIQEDLRRFKNRMEAGEVPTTDGQPAGERSRLDLTNPF